MTAQILGYTKGIIETLVTQTQPLTENCLMSGCYYKHCIVAFITSHHHMCLCVCCAQHSLMLTLAITYEFLTSSVDSLLSYSLVVRGAVHPGSTKAGTMSIHQSPEQVWWGEKKLYTVHQDLIGEWHWLLPFLLLLPSFFFSCSSSSSSSTITTTITQFYLLIILYHSYSLWYVTHFTTK